MTQAKIDQHLGRFCHAEVIAEILFLFDRFSLVLLCVLSLSVAGSLLISGYSVFIVHLGYYISMFCAYF
jgi:hypothetical protein